MVFFTKDALAREIIEFGWCVGDHSYGFPVVHKWGNDGRLLIGRYCSFGGAIQIYLGGNHRDDWVTTYPFSALRDHLKHVQGHPATRGDVVIGNDVWIGQHAILLSGVGVGDGAVIAAHAVVTKDVAAYTVVAGNPARPVRSRFDQTDIDELVKIGWWDWPDEEVDAAAGLMLSTDIRRFISYAKSRGLE